MRNQPKDVVENSFRLSAERMDKNGLRTSGGEGSGTLTIEGGGQVLELKFELKSSVLKVYFDGHDQSIETVRKPSLGGFKTYLLCTCHRSCRMLYKLPANNEFKCRECENLTYISCRTSTKTVNGKIFRDYNRLIVFIKRREMIKNAFYNGKPSKKFLVFLERAKKAGFHGYVEEQLSALKNIEQMNEVILKAKGVDHHAFWG